MSIISRLTPLFNWVRNHKYLFVTIIFLLIVIIFDDNSMIMHFRNQSKINALEDEIAVMLRDSLEVERKNALIAPGGEIVEIERICREKYDMHTPYEDVWYMPADDSYMVRLIEDAGGDYIYKGGNTTGGSRGISLERALLLVTDADIWLNVGQCNSLADLHRVAPHFCDTEVVRHGRVYNNNRRQGSSGGSDFWESAIVRPDVVLAELAAIVAGEACEPCYYQQLQ